MNLSKLLSPLTLGQTELKNRVVMAPLTRSRAIGNIPNELMATYYSQRAGAGLIITEGTSPSPDGYAGRAEKDLEADRGDLVAFGRPFISNPDLVTRMEKDARLTLPEQDTFYTLGKEGYTDYPFLKEQTA